MKTGIKFTAWGSRETATYLSTPYLKAKASQQMEMAIHVVETWMANPGHHDSTTILCYVLQ